MTRRLHITVLVDPATVPPDDPEFRDSEGKTITEYHVCHALRGLGHRVSAMGAEYDIASVATTLKQQAPDLVFNLTEQFCGDRQMDKNIAALLELLDIPFTGAGAMGLLLARDKRLCKQILRLHRIRVPNFISLPYRHRVRVPANLPYPMVVQARLRGQLGRDLQRIPGYRRAGSGRTSCLYPRTMETGGHRRGVHRGTRALCQCHRQQTSDSPARARVLFQREGRSGPRPADVSLQVGCGIP